MANRDEIIKKNIAFMYGRGEKTALQDPDKISYVRSAKFVDRDEINDFESDEFAFLSPAHPCPVMLADDGELYPSFEHALQASKMADKVHRAAIKEIGNLRELKKMGSKYADNNQQWREQGPQIAEQLLRDKFIRNKELRQRLVSTGKRYIVFKNNFNDQFWGVSSTDGKGQNMLGKLLEKTRLSIEKGDDLDRWVRDISRCYDADEVDISVVVKRNDEVLDRRVLEKKTMLSAGKTPENDVVCENPTVSRRHCMLVGDKRYGLVVIDLGSSNRTFVNDRAIEPFMAVPVCEHDLVRLGSSSRVYSFSLDTLAGEKRRQRIYSKVANPELASGDKEGNADLTVFVGNLPYSALEADVSAMLEPCGPIVRFSMPKDKSTGLHKGFAFVEFADSRGFTQALMRNGDELQGRNVKITRQTAGKGDSKSTSQPKPANGYKKDYSAVADDPKSYYTRRAPDSDEPGDLRELGERRQPRRSWSRERDSRPDSRRHRSRSSSHSPSVSHRRRDRHDSGPARHLRKDGHYCRDEAGRERGDRATKRRRSSSSSRSRSDR